ncbi:hypothetical protein BDU57DRAFT_248672 [Ampelomyces quisqualis]|uniref:Uncharacterized protein n=1 Tax=Ampelomyces quisqualis TaxID=50730 RepID=A0A6A5QQP8_AMPQU|nr:hypothetical protein BDU57DRAFT_248672 [Ampelomyces quisqualis]
MNSTAQHNRTDVSARLIDATSFSYYKKSGCNIRAKMTRVFMQRQVKSSQSKSRLTYFEATRLANNTHVTTPRHSPPDLPSTHSQRNVSMSSYVLVHPIRCQNEGTSSIGFCRQLRSLHMTNMPWWRSCRPTAYWRAVASITGVCDWCRYHATQAGADRVQRAQAMDY